MQLQVGVKVIIKNSNGLYLFLQKTELLQNETQQSWDIPGGRIDPNEPLLDALRREVSEEIGSELSGELQLINAQDIFVAAKDIHVIRLTYITTQDIDPITLSDEHQSYIWASAEDITALNVDPYLRETLALL
jgi:8-oxo-dGTP diphosphatase